MKTEIKMKSKVHAKTINKYIILAGMVAATTGVFSTCGHGDNDFDASGAFEAEETIVSSELTAVIQELNIEEGQFLTVGEEIGRLDCVQLRLKKKQLSAQISALLERKPNIRVQLSALREQLKTAGKEKIRITKLIEGNAATSKQLDDINAQIDVLQKQLEARKSSLSISSYGISKDVVPLQIQIEQLDDQLNKCDLVNPLNGTVLVKYANAHEMIMMGHPLYKIADLENILLRVYISGNQLAQIKLNQRVRVFTDDGKGGFRETKGVIVWISDKAEFTPKTIQTKDERATMVYALKVKVKNNGLYKIGMYGEIKFK